MPDTRRSSRVVARAVLRTIFVYSTLVVLYLMANSIAHRETMFLPLTHFFDAPTEGVVLAAALPCSILSFFCLRVEARIGDLTEGVGH